MSDFGKDYSMRIFCKKHGDISDCSIFLRYKTVEKQEDKTVSIENNNIFCPACLSSLYSKFQESGDVGEIMISVPEDVTKKD
jgi:hypothetical protein